LLQAVRLAKLQAPQSGEANAVDMSKAAIGMEEPSAQAKHGLRKTVLAVAASFFGVRGSKEHEADMAQLKPLHVIAVGLMMAAIFVLSLVLVVRMVVA
jgi:hypothetical protein